MRLKQLEIRGFKTFATPVTLKFESAVTAIVGPNGSGKSNLADAVRWVLGEQSTRALRTRKSEDVIFAGGKSRAPLGMAEVTILLDNSDGWLDVPQAEVSLSRRSFRSGDNEYYINGARARLRDLTDLVLKANAGPASVVIGQGMADLALSLRPEERRFLIEEAADVKRHQLKIKESQDKLATTEDNMTRVADLIAELQPRVANLERQAEKARRYAGINQRLQETMLRWYRHNWWRGRLQLAAARQRESDEQRQLASLTAQLEAVHQQHQLRQREHFELQRQLQQGSELSLELGQRLSQAELLVAVGSERLQSLTNRQSDLDRRCQEAEASALELRELGEQLEAERREAEEQLALRQSEAAALAKSGEAARQARQQAGAAVEATQRAADQLTDRWAAAGAGNARLEADRVARQREHELLLARQEDLNARRAVLDADLAREADDQQSAQQGLRQAEAEIKALQAKQAALGERQQQLQASLAAARRRREALLARQSALGRWQQELSGYHSGVRAVINAARSRGPQALQGVVGAVAELLRVPQRYETAIEVALGGRVQDLVVKRWRDAEAAIELLKRTGGGRATFLPLDTIRPSSQQHPPTGEGVHGVAAELVSAEGENAAVVSHLLGRTLVVDNLQVARRSLAACPPGWQIVTLAGEVVRASGAVTGGSTREQQGGMLAQEREWRELPQRLETAAAELATAEAAMAAAAAEAAALAEQLNSAQHRQRDLAAENERRRRDAGLWRNDVQRLQQRAAQLQQELRRSGEALAEQDKREQTERQKLQQLQLEREQARQALASAREALAELEADDGDLLRRLAVATAARDTAQAELERSSRELEERRRQLRQAERLIASLAEERVSLAEQHATAAAAQQDAALEVTALTAQRTQQRLEQSELRKALPQLEQAISALEAERQALYRSHAEANSRYAAADAQRQKAEDDLVGLRERAGGELDIEAGEQGQLRFPWEEEQQDEAYQGEADPEALKRQLDHLRTQIRSLSSVNLEATRDYEELSNRLNFLTTQQADLEEASRSLRQAISDLNSTVAERFELTFNQVAEEFRNCFSELFGGGAARLTLTQPDNLHQSGIEIVAQPPGKRWQSLALLSGGERALTAVALLFALLRVKPTPFCVLDEVDAALDDANVARAARMITELSAQTQFVVITHNKGTMEEAGALYGITMAHDGISKLVSMRMADVISDTGD